VASSAGARDRLAGCCGVGAVDSDPADSPKLKVAADVDAAEGPALAFSISSWAARAALDACSLFLDSRSPHPPPPLDAGAGAAAGAGWEAGAEVAALAVHVEARAGGNSVSSASCGAACISDAVAAGSALPLGSSPGGEAVRSDAAGGGPRKDVGGGGVRPNGPRLSPALSAGELMVSRAMRMRRAALVLMPCASDEAGAAELAASWGCAA